MSRRGLAGKLAAMALVLCACQPSAQGTPATASPSPAASPTASPPSSATPPASPSARPTTRPTASPPGAPRAHPGRPYDAAAILEAMRSSRRPGGVPDQVETDAVARAIADATWTWDGSAWSSISIGGSCGPATCTIEVGGSAPDAAAADLYTFRVTLADEAVTLRATDLHAYPSGLEASLDRAARAAVPHRRLRGLALVAARWLPPPDTDSYWLAYRTGGEEGSPGLDVLLDLASGEVLRIEDAG